MLVVKTFHIVRRLLECQYRAGTEDQEQRTEKISFQMTENHKIKNEITIEPKNILQKYQYHNYI